MFRSMNYKADMVKTLEFRGCEREEVEVSISCNGPRRTYFYKKHNFTKLTDSDGAIY